MKLKIFIYCLFGLFLASCASKKRVVKKKPPVVVSEPTPKKLPSVHENKHVKNLESKNTKLNKSTLTYIEKYAPIAVHEMQKFNIPASITLAQGILESGAGKGRLASKANNHFGIKCHTDWQGERVYYDDDKRGECFRKYQYVATSFRDHSTFLSRRKRYAFLFNYDKNYKKWAKGLKKAGYATDSKYPKKLIKIIEDYKLYKFDTVKKNGFKAKKKKKKEVEILKPKNTIGKYYQVKKGDTLYSLARKFKTTVAKLKEINGLKSNQLSIGQHLLTN
ncbi:MAG: glucosaminidase domain-containing protein [Polaribacter sp.]